MELGGGRFRWIAVVVAVVSVLAVVGCGGRPVANQVLDPTATGALPPYPGRGDFAGTHRFFSSFESPRDFDGFYWVPAPHLGTTTQEMSHSVVHSGSSSYHATITGTNAVQEGQNTNHRAYPTVQLYRTDAGPYRSRVRIEFWIWLDVDLSGGRSADWFSLATLTSYADDSWYQSQLLNLNVDGRLRLQHVPSAGQSIIDIYQTKTIQFPMRQWVKITVLLDYTSDNAWRHPYLAAWQDEQLVSAARFDGRVDPNSTDRSQWPRCLHGWDGTSVAEAESRCQLSYRDGALAQAHFGLYAPPLLGAGELYEDDLEILDSAVS